MLWPSSPIVPTNRLFPNFTVAKKGGFPWFPPSQNSVGPLIISPGENLILGIAHDVFNANAGTDETQRKCGPGTHLEEQTRHLHTQVWRRGEVGYPPRPPNFAGPPTPVCWCRTGPLARFPKSSGRHPLLRNDTHLDRRTVFLSGVAPPIAAKDLGGGRQAVPTCARGLAGPAVGNF